VRSVAILPGKAAAVTCLPSGTYTEYFKMSKIPKITLLFHRRNGSKTAALWPFAKWMGNRLARRCPSRTSKWQSRYEIPRQLIQVLIHYSSGGRPGCPSWTEHQAQTGRRLGGRGGQQMKCIVYKPKQTLFPFILFFQIPVQ
jgi:hypothetical protein